MEQLARQGKNVEDWWYYDGISSFALSGAYIEDGYKAKSLDETYESQHLLRSNAVELSEMVKQNRATVPSNASNALPAKISGPRHMTSAFTYEACMQSRLMTTVWLNRITGMPITLLFPCRRSKIL